MPYTRVYSRRKNRPISLMQAAANDSEIDVVLNMLAGESSESVQVESGEWSSWSVEMPGKRSAVLKVLVASEYAEQIFRLNLSR